MILAISVIVILLISFMLAALSAGKELSVPPEVAELKIKKEKSVSGVILFFKKKIVHYSSSKSS